MKEDLYNMALARKLDGETEVTFEYEYGLKGNTPLTASIRIDIVTDEYVIEGGKDSGPAWIAFNKQYLPPRCQVKNQPLLYMTLIVGGVNMNIAFGRQLRN